MAFEKGKSGNPNGREPGSKNVRTQEWEDFGKAIIEGNLDKMRAHIEAKWNEDPSAAFDLVVELMEYFKPKLARTEHTGKVDSELTVKHKWGA